MKCFWSLLIAVAMTATGVAWGGVVHGDALLAAAPAGAGNGFRFQAVRDWDHRGDWGHRRDWDGHVHTRIFLGFGNAWNPYWGPYWGAPPAYYYNPPVVVTQPQPPTVYISPDQQKQPYYWYYCESAKRYYPYVKQCPGGWMKVVPREPGNP